MTSGRLRTPAVLGGGLALALLVLVVLVLSGGRPRGGRQPGTRADQPPPDAEVVFSSAAGLTNGWQDYGWAPRSVAAGKPASLDFSKYGGWILAKPNLSTEVGGLRVKVKAPPELGDFLEIRLSAGQASQLFPQIAVGPRNRRDLDDGWMEIWLPLSALNPNQSPFDRFIIRARAGLPAKTQVLFAEIAFTAGESTSGGTDGGTGEDLAPVEARMAVSCQRPGHAISPLIYGIAFKPSHDHRESHQWKVGAAARRWGGNPTSRYNWMLGNAWNTAHDWFYRNVNYTSDPSYTYERFLEDNLDRGVATALTVPTLGWVAKDTESASFPVSAFGRQHQMAPENPNFGNGVGTDGKPLTPGPPTMTSVPAPPEFVERWVRAIRKKDATRGRSVQQYILDNEPALWNSTHRDVHPEPVTYDELLDRMIRYGTAVRRADPEASIAGPAEWGWPGFLFSAKDQAVGFQLKPDRRAHGDKPLLPWLLGELRKHREKTGVRILDVVDVHHYSHFPGAAIGTRGRVDRNSAALRIRSTRALWDPTYHDESWIDDKVRLIPRLKEWIAENDPGLGISIGEWNFGAEQHMSGGLAVAEALGRFATEGITSAFYWDYPPDRTPAFWAFRAFRNFDDKGGRFQGWLVPSTSAHPLASVFASRSEAGDHMVLVLLNMNPTVPLDARIDLGSCGKVLSSKAYSYKGDPRGFAQAPSEPKTGEGTLEQRLEEYSMTVLDLQLQPASRAPAGTPAKKPGRR